MTERAAAGAGLELTAHPHMLRHACGYALANKAHDTRAIQGWLGHRSINQHGDLYGDGAEQVQGLPAGVSHAVPRHRFKSLMPFRSRRKMFPAKFSENVQTLPL
jgi:integrase